MGGRGRDPRKDFSGLHGYSYASLEADLAAAKAAAKLEGGGGWLGGKSQAAAMGMQMVRRFLGGGGRPR